MAAKIIAFEGADRVGKETQSKLLFAYLRNKGYKATRVEVPVKDQVTHRIIYKMLHDGHAKTHPNVFQFFQHANRKLFQTFTLPKLVREHDFVILDRWKMSSYVYGNVCGANADRVHSWCSSLEDPHLTIVLHGDSRKLRKDDVYEADNTLQEKVRNMYVKVASALDDCEIVDANGYQMNVHHTIVKLVQEYDLLPSDTPTPKVVL